MTSKKDALDAFGRIMSALTKKQIPELFGDCNTVQLYLERSQEAKA
jgi:hypothetical protein